MPLISALSLVCLPLLPPFHLQEPSLLQARDGDSRLISPEFLLPFPDLDGDGVEEFLIGSPNHPEGGFVHLLSGANQEKIWVHRRPGNTRFGYRLALIQDIDGDQVPEVAATEPWFGQGPDLRGAVHLLSGATGATLWTFEGLYPLQHLGDSMVSTGDISGDGIDDLLVGAPQTGFGIPQQGAVVFLSGADGTLLRTLAGASNKEQLGTAVGTVGDLDGDGVPEALISSMLPSGLSSGEVRVLSLRTGAVLHTLRSGRSYDRFGASVAGLGDLDGDGLPEILVGAPFSDPGGLKNAGAVHLYSGATGQEIFHVDGSATGDKLGKWVAGTEDLDGDLVPDLACGAPRAAGGSGAVYLLSGANGATLATLAPAAARSDFGSWVGLAGDRDGDGIQDLAVNGGPYWDLSIHSPVSSALLITIEATAEMDSIGGALASAGDLDGDGLPDLWVSSAIRWQSSKVLAVSSTDLRTLLEIPNPTGQGEYGFALAGGSDLDRDGIPDLAVGNPRGPGATGQDAGTLHLHSGRDGSELRRIDGFGGRFGQALAFLPDTDGDGIDEILVGAPEAMDNSGNDTGKAYLYSSGTGTLLLEAAGSLAKGRFGQAVAWLGDFDRDGTADFLVGAPRNPLWLGTQPGLVRAYSGNDASLLFELTGTDGGDRFGNALARLGDLDLDGVDDFAVGAPGTPVSGITNSGAVHAFSGSTGQPLWSALSPFPSESFGQRLAALGDVDGDGIPDLLAQAPTFYDSQTRDIGRVAVLSGSDGTELASIPGPPQWPSTHGDGLAGLEDGDGNGLAEFVIGDPRRETSVAQEAGRIEVWGFDLQHPYLAPVELVAGQPMDLEVYGAQGGTVGFGLSLVGPGPTWIPQLGLALDLSRPLHAIGQAAPNANGQAAISGTVPAAWLGRTVWLQAVDYRPGAARTTNPLKRLVR